MERSVGIVVHQTRPEALHFAREVVAWLGRHSVRALVDPDAASRLGQPALAADLETWQSAEFIVTLGGDGTILKAARMAAPGGVPILGVHMGRFGFIAEAHPRDLFSVLGDLLQGKRSVEERMMLRAEIWRGGECVHSGVGLNDMLIKSKMSRMLQLRTLLGGSIFATYPADGIVVATPTGSTAYALSAGGPLIEPTVQAFVVVPVCPHTLSARPMVVPADETIGVELEADGDDVVFAIDGVDPFALLSQDRVLVRRAEYTTRLIVLDRATFYRKVRDRYLYGERLNE